jgi:hypothetical protein
VIGLSYLTNPDHIVLSRWWTHRNNQENEDMTVISDDYMNKMMTQTKNFSLVLLKAGPNIKMEGAEKIIWEHGRRNFSLRAEGLLPMVFPVRDGAPIAGVGIFNASVEETRLIMDDDPCVKAGILTYEVHQTRSFPGDCLPV